MTNSKGQSEVDSWLQPNTRVKYWLVAELKNAARIYLQQTRITYTWIQPFRLNGTNAKRQKAQTLAKVADKKLKST